MNATSPRPARDAKETRARILEAAQKAFSRRGYSQTGVRDIAGEAGVASSLVMKYFGSKANLFYEALKESLAGTALPFADKSDFGAVLTHAIENPDVPVVAPAMIALSLGEDEARQAAERVVLDHVIRPTAEWIGAPDAETRATCVLMLSTGFSIFQRYMSVELAPDVREGVAKWMTASLQRAIDGPMEE